jgi:hypothetical protein
MFCTLCSLSYLVFRTKNWADNVTKRDQRNLPHDMTGLVLHEAFFYDFTVWLMTLGRERAFREKILYLARLKPGESVPDLAAGQAALQLRPNGMLDRLAWSTGSMHPRKCWPERRRRR